MSTEFNAPYLFRQNNLVVLKHHHGKYIRVNPDKLADADGNGGTGQFAKWHCELEGDLIKLKSNHTGKYLRIWQNGRDVDVDGAGGPFTLFKVHVVESPNVVKLESERFAGRYIAVTERGEVVVGEGGKHCSITFFREGDAILPKFQQQQQHVIPQPSYDNFKEKKINLGEFTGKYHFKSDTEVVVLHSQGEFLRVNPDALQFADAHGGTGEFARWKAELEDNNQIIKLKSSKTGKYLRVYQEGLVVDVNGIGGDFCLFRIHHVSHNSAKLESVKFNGKYLAVHQGGMVGVGIGGANCALTFFHRPINNESFVQEQQFALEAQMEAMRISHEQEIKRQEELRQQQILAQQQLQQLQQEDMLKHQQEIARRQKEEFEKQQLLILEAQQAAIKKAQQVEQKVEEHNLSEDAKLVKKWLESIQMTQYFETFIRNGFDRLSSIGVITESDLEKMSVALGHRKVLIAAAHLAPYAGKSIALRSLNYDTYISGHKLGHGKDDNEELGAHKVLDEECVWVCNQIEEGRMTLKNAKHGGYLRIPKIIDKEACTQHEVDNRCELQITLVPAHPGTVAIFCPSNGNYLSCKEPNLFGKSTITCKPHVGKQECFTIIIR